MKFSGDLPSQSGGALPQANRSVQPEWLQRLWANQRVPLGTEKLYWWGAQRVCQHAEPGAAGVLRVES